MLPDPLNIKPTMIALLGIVVGVSISEWFHYIVRIHFLVLQLVIFMKCYRNE